MTSDSSPLRTDHSGSPMVVIALFMMGCLVLFMVGATYWMWTTTAAMTDMAKDLGVSGTGLLVLDIARYIAVLVALSLIGYAARETYSVTRDVISADSMQ